MGGEINEMSGTVIRMIFGWAMMQINNLPYDPQRGRIQATSSDIEIIASKTIGHAMACPYESAEENGKKTYPTIPCRGMSCYKFLFFYESLP
jgi:hypothetical protein